MFQHMVYHHTLYEFKGENITDGSVWISKTHHPTPVFKGRVASFNKALCCIRHPLDTLCSMFHFSISFTMDQLIKGNYNKEHPEFWDKFMKEQIDHFKRYHDRIKEDAKNKLVPVYYFRYEDLYKNPQQTLEEIFCYLLNVTSIEGTVIQKRIEEVVNEGHQASVSYVPKDLGLDINHHRFTDDQINYAKEQLGDFIHYFGYCDHPKIENPYSFFCYNGSSTQKESDEFLGFREHNRETLEWCITHPEELKKVDYVVNRTEDLIKIENAYHPEMILKTEIDI